MYLAQVEAALRTPAGELARRQISISIDTTLDVAREEAGAADGRTGRNVHTSHATVAQLIGASVSTVRRARALLVILGFAQVVREGYSLPRQGYQLKAAAHRVLTLPRPAPVDNPPSHSAQQQPNEHLPRSGYLDTQSNVRFNIPSRPGGREERGATRRINKKKGRRGPQIPPGVRRLGGQLLQRLPYLTQTAHANRLSHVLLRLNLDETGWTAQDILDLIDYRAVKEGLYAIKPCNQRDPLAYFTHELTAALSNYRPTIEPVIRRQRRREALALSRERFQAETAARRAAAADWNDPEFIERQANLRRQAGLRPYHTPPK